MWLTKNLKDVKYVVRISNTSQEQSFLQRSRNK